MIGKMVRLFHFILYKSVVVWRMRTILINANVKKTYIGEVSVQKDNNSDSSFCNSTTDVDKQDHSGVN